MAKKYKNYKKTKNNIKIGDRSFEAVFPKGHSRIKGLIYVVKNLNNDPSTKRVGYHTICYTLKRGAENWQQLYNGTSHNFKLGKLSGNDIAIDQLLFELEYDKKKKEYLRKEEIKEIKNQMKKLQKRLQDLESK